MKSNDGPSKWSAIPAYIGSTQCEGFQPIPGDICTLGYDLWSHIEPVLHKGHMELCMGLGIDPQDRLHLKGTLNLIDTP